MGNIRTKDIKKVSFDLRAAYPDRFKDDFETNKSVIKELDMFTTKIIRNKVAGYVTRLARRKRF
ncbi:MAG: 30S ribosomal protein S17e [Candidatus Aenigmarchaeota archaeon]|nr:30S ribosomal protein S17e [Candidatus Aenigmarchaeota archaeon]